MKKVIVAAVVLIALTIGAWMWFQPFSATEIPARMEQALATPAPDHSPLTLIEQTVAFEDGSEATFRLDDDFELKVAAEGLGKARFMALSPDNRLFVPDIVDYSLSHEGKLFILENFNETSGRFETKHTYLSGLRGPNSVAFYTDSAGKHWLYLALTAHLVRYEYKEGDTRPSGEPEIITEFPNQQSPGEESVVWHITRTIFFEGDRLYVSVGSGCNACEELAGDKRAMIYSMNPDGSDQKIEGEGLRNTVGIEIAKGKLYATLNGVDHLGTEAPDEAIYEISGGQHYGWPYCYLKEGKLVPDNTIPGNTDFDCASVPAPLTTFPARSAPLGLRYFSAGFYPVLAESFLVALHGSFEPSTESGYEIRRVTLEGQNEVFMDGFIKDGVTIARPVDFLERNNNSFFFTDDYGGRVFYIKAKE